MLATIRKALVAAFSGAVAALVTAAQDGSIEAADWVTVALAAYPTPASFLAASATSRAACAAARLAWLAPPSKMGNRACGAKAQPQVPPLKSPDNSLLAEPRLAVSATRGTVG